MFALSLLRNQNLPFSFAMPKKCLAGIKGLKKSRDYGKKHLVVSLSNPRQTE
jgi:hypothetical protein